jgi:hypothetical protein
MKYMTEDGNKFLKFYWKHIETNLHATILSSNQGMTYQILSLPNKIVGVMLTLPVPKVKGEVFNLLLIKKPEKFSLFRVGFSRVFGLEYEGTTEDGTILTGIYELTPRARNVRIRDGEQPDKKLFFDTVMKILKIDDGGVNEF